MADILKEIGDRTVAVCRELTKLNEEVFHGTVAEALNHFDHPKGEFTLVITGRSSNKSQSPDLEETARDVLVRRKSEGFKVKDAVADAVEATGLSRNAVYRMWVRLDE